MRHFSARSVIVTLAVIGCSRGDKPAPTAEARAAHKAAIAAAAKDRMLLQYLVKDAEQNGRRTATLRRESAGYLTGDTSVIWFAFFAGDTLVVLDETRRGPAGVEENARYLFRDSVLHYVALDRAVTAHTSRPIRTRLAFGYDSAGTLAATSKNVNDAAVPLDTAADIGAVSMRARLLRDRVLRAVTR